ncbi:uncharacterized protein LOC131005701 isoform X2 [Salvia miltiorrhiza]|uniref:uncharacterized protein LOC131005701 isoform X2 n=1 Tax=Salvia miltiorrhiza TaxID=226208 RepID=UPI0025ACEA3C|nr:uncharacterized protein LOC131005701 isoform X2 [Salvia miltiorrhiza]
MAEIELHTVLQFFRKNGLSECESALMEDIMDKKSQVGSSAFETLCFPPLRIPATRRPPPHFADGAVVSPNGSSDDEFVSLGSSTTEFPSSDFTNPYGIHNTTRPASQASSDRLSQFGTARDYPDFDMQDDLFWYKEDDEDYVMPPHFDGRDFDGDPSEDKFVMSVQTEEPVEDETKYNVISEGRKRWALALEESLKCEHDNDCDEENFQLEKSYKKCEEHFNDYSCSAPLCACCNGIGTVYTGELKIEDVFELEARGEHHPTSETTFSKEGSPTKIRPIEHNDYGFIDDEIIAGESHEAEAVLDEEAGVISDELLTYDKEDDYEIFNLRVVHRKNRTGFEENKEFPIVLNSVIAGRYYVTEILGSAAFSRVVQAHDLYSGIDVCLKIIKNDKDFFDQSLDEIKLLKFVNKNDPADEHHILRLYDYFYHQEHLFIVTELLRANLYEFQKYNRESGAEAYFTMHRLQVIIRQCLEALVYLHDLGIVHCDLKPENILIKSYRRCEIKVIDLGSSCFQTDSPLSLYVQSRSYRAPEVMLGLPYDQKIDLWSVGCILAELYSGEVCIMCFFQTKQSRCFLRA